MRAFLPSLHPASLIILAMLGCSTVGDPIAPRTVAPSARATAIDTDSRASWSFNDQYVSGVGSTGEPVFTATRIRGDGAGEYRGGECGVQAKVFWYDADLSRSGDAVFDADFNSPGTCPSRTLQFTWQNGTSAALAPFMNARQVMQLAAGESRLQDFTFDIGSSRTCARLGFLVTSHRGVRVTRTDASEGTAPRTWTLASTGDHMAACYVTSKGKLVATGELRFLPFLVRISELPVLP